MLDFLPLLDYYNLKLAGSRYIRSVVRLATCRLSRGEYCQQISKEYGERHGSLSRGYTRPAMLIMIQRDQEALVRHYLRRYQEAGSPQTPQNKPHQEMERRVFRSALHWAAFYGSVPVARLLLDKVDLRTTKSAASPLHIAAMKGHTEVVELLLEHGASIDPLNSDGKTPLQLALEEKNKTIAALLRSKGAAASLDEVRQNYKNGWVNLLPGSFKNAKYPPLISVKPRNRFRVCDVPDMPTTREQVLKAFANYRFSKAKKSAAQNNRRLRSLVRLAISLDDPTLLRSILDEGFDLKTALDRLRNTALHFAVRNNKKVITNEQHLERTETVRLLLDHGADVNAQGGYGVSSLHLATQPQLARLLLERGANVHVRGDGDRTLAHYHVLNCTNKMTLSSDEELLDLLLSWGLDYNAKDVENKSPLNLAIVHSPHLVNKLLSFDVNVNTLEPADQSPLSRALSTRKIDTCQSLLNHGADLCWRDRNGRNLLHHALDGAPFNDGVHLLLESGIEVNARDNRGVTPLFIAASFGRPQLVSALIENDAEVNITDIEGYTPLHYVVRDYGGPTAQIIKTLLDNGVDVNAKSGDGTMPIHLATKRDGNHHIVKVLLGHGADTNARDGKGRTPLHCVVLQKYPWFGDLLKVLMDHGARVDEHDEDGLTPLDIVMDQKREEYVRILLEDSASKSMEKPE